MAYAATGPTSRFRNSTGMQYSVRDFVNAAAKELGMTIEWQGQGIDEVGIWNGKKIVQVDPRYFRPTEVETLLGMHLLQKKS